ncbi:hypothetical protein DPMN_194032 [Dreissena polymorpha]|uniref:Uncharacterized protein n=1 Tax=Dreissena polymorpha TaxID=45954 RepID=A0A9D3Y1R5_DREPO|nr:hypothetical protein DPMN_194032 [Dreissena polymorpha]
MFRCFHYSAIELRCAYRPRNQHSCAATICFYTAWYVLSTILEFQDRELVSEQFDEYRITHLTDELVDGVVRYPQSLHERVVAVL